VNDRIGNGNPDFLKMRMGMMNCRRIEKLMPLFVEGDLDAEAMQDVSIHLGTCPVCSQMVSEYSASQAWLRTYEAPEFDNNFFRDLKQSVMLEIEQNQSRPSWLQRLQERWQQNLAFAMALVMLILVGAFVLTMYKGKATIEPPDTQISTGVEPKIEGKPKEKSPEEKKPEQEISGNRRVVRHSFRRGQPKPAMKIIDEPLPLAMQPDIEPLDRLTINIFENNLATNPLDLGRTGELPIPPAGTRIEFQTSDPAIRIIWFAPKSNNSQSSKIDAE
jgi:hypothetical protein